MGAASDTRQTPLFAVRQFLPKPYEAGSLYDVLERYGELIIRRQDWPEASDAQGGTWAYCPVMMSKLVVMQRAGGWSDRETVHRATYDLSVKACLGLGVEQKGPSQSTLCRHREAMQSRELHEVYQLRFVRLLKTLELVDKQEAVMVDSVPVAGAGQVLDSYNLLAAGIRRTLRQVAEHQGQSPKEVARRLGLLDYDHRGIKGKLAVDWDSEEGPRQMLARLVADAVRLGAEVQRLLEVATPGTEQGAAPASSQGEQSAKQAEPEPQEVAASDAAQESAPTDDPRPVDGTSDAAGGTQAGAGATSASPGTTGSPAALSGAEQLRQGAADLLSVIAHDVEFGPEGEIKGLLERAAGDRIISMTDPQMRHGRKSASVLIAGYKAQVVASLLYGFILMVKVFRANQHDGQNLPQILDGLRAMGLWPRKLIGDHAYGTLANHVEVQRRNAQDLIHPQELVARMARPHNGGRFTKDQFEVDFLRRSLKCPAGQECLMTRWASRDGERGWEFEFPQVMCDACPQRAQCINPKAKGVGRTVFLVEQKERLIRAHLLRRQELDFIAILAERPAVERVIAGLAQCGGKTARRMGQDNVSFDETLSALAYNLRRLGSVLVKQPEVAARLASVRVVFLCLVLAVLLRRRWYLGQPPR